MNGTDTAALRRLAERAGILPEYVDQTGKETRETSDETRRALLRAMRFDGSDGEPRVRVVEREAMPELDLGYHSVDGETVIVVPPRCVTPRDLIGDDKSFGITANLYTIRSASNWGIGDFTDLASLGEWCGSVGGDFVGVNPLHALHNRGNDVSPYSPVSRLFRNPMYVDVAKIPELRGAPDLCDRLSSPEFAAELDTLRESRDVRYEQIAAVKGLAFDALHKVFAEQVKGTGDARARAYQAFVDDAGESLERFATWMAIAERCGGDWHSWPGELKEADSAAVRRFAAEHATRVEFHKWIQFEADRQLGLAADSARSAGMRIGLYQDLAVGSSGSGADTWAFPDLFAHGASVGAPPDPYAMQGQNWGFPPINPHALRRSGYRYFIDLVRQAFRHAGALRIDHVLGFFRLFWIPEGKSGEHGAYVRYPTDDLFGILALESVRNKAIVVGEDLGTVPPEVPRTLEKWGVLSSKVMFFERDKSGGFNPSASYPSLALATADTHDMAPVTGFWNGRDIELRHEVGLIDDVEAETAEQQREDERAALLDRLAAETVLPEDKPHTPAQLRGAVHAFMCRTPSQLVAIALDDLAGESEPVNVPGVGPDRFHSWTRKMADPLEVIVTSDDTATALRCDGRRGVRNA